MEEIYVALEKAEGAEASNLIVYALDSISDIDSLNHKVAQLKFCAGVAACVFAQTGDNAWRDLALTINDYTAAITSLEYWAGIEEGE